MKNENVFILGIRRSGNHAIASWIRPQLKNNMIRYFNDHFFNTLSNNINSTQRRTYVYKYIDEKMNIVNDEKMNIVNDEINDNLFGLENQSINLFNENYEKWKKNINIKLKEDKKLNCEISDNNKQIVIIRNPWNNMASEIQWHYNGRNYNVPKDKLIELWEEYYNYFMDNKNNKFNFIIYDKWFIDKEYRKNISEQLGFEFSDNNLNLIEKTGNGSSFTKRMYNGHAQEMNVLNRYKEVENFPDLQMFIVSNKGKELKEKWNHLCDLENITQLKIKQI